MTGPAEILAALDYPTPTIGCAWPPADHDGCSSDAAWRMTCRQCGRVDLLCEQHKHVMQDVARWHGAMCETTKQVLPGQLAISFDRVPG